MIRTEITLGEGKIAVGTIVYTDTKKTCLRFQDLPNTKKYKIGDDVKDVVCNSDTVVIIEIPCLESLKVVQCCIDKIKTILIEENKLNELTKEKILGMLSDCWMDLFYYDRREDEECPIDAIENAIKSGVITVDEMVDNFRNQIEVNIKGD